jgi:uncharacterized protein (DUF4415 family)
MVAKRKGSSRRSPQKDDAPELTAAWAAEADLLRGAKVLRRGRPKLEYPKQLLSLRLPPDVIASWKATGPGWQTRMAEVLQRSVARTRRHPG